MFVLRAVSWIAGRPDGKRTDVQACLFANILTCLPAGHYVCWLDDMAANLIADK
jgi:hypothetical protein